MARLKFYYKTIPSLLEQLNPRWVIVGLLALSVFMYFKKKSPTVKTLSFISLKQPVEVNTCLSKEKCFVVYVAPWCPACHQFIDQYRQFGSLLEQKNVGIVFIVGADENRQNEIAMKDSLSPVAVVDSVNQDFRKIHKINRFPTVYVTDKSAKVLYSGKDSYNYLNKRLNE